MFAMPRSRTAATLGAGAILALAPGVLAGPAAAMPSPPKNYSMNSAGGEYAPAVSSQIPPVSSPVQAGEGFAWGDAAAGAGAGLLIALSALGGRTAARRRRLVTG